MLTNTETCFCLDRSPHYVNGVRRLTPLECERLQGFPDGWTDGVSETQRYNQCGNAVTTKVIKSIMEQLIRGKFTQAILSESSLNPDIKPTHSR